MPISDRVATWLSEGRRPTSRDQLEWFDFERMLIAMLKTQLFV